MSSSQLSFLVRKCLMREISSVVTFVPVCQGIPHQWVHKVEKILKFFSPIINKGNHFFIGNNLFLQRHYNVDEIPY